MSSTEPDTLFEEGVLTERRQVDMFAMNLR